MRVCQHCGKEILKGPPRKVFCCRKCKELKRQQPYSKHKKSLCSFCGFVPVHPCQLDVDHIDGNHQNNEESNLQTLCANCHRLKTYLSREY